MRGRLVYPFVIELACLSTQDIEHAVSDGFDHDFREPKQIDDGSQYGADARAEVTRYIRAQVEPVTFDKLRQYSSGDSRDARIALVSHFAELERAGLVNADGTPAIRVNDRLAAIYEDTAERALVMSVPARPGLYLHEAQPMGFGFGKKRNLLYLDFRARPQAK